MLAELDGLSSAQWGLVTTAQAERRGVSRLQMSRLAAAEHLRRVGQGVYLDAGSPEGPFTHVQAAWLAAEPARTAEERLADRVPQVVVGGATAAFLHEVGDLQPEPVELLVARPRVSRRAGIRYRARLVPVEQVTVVAGLPVTSVARTISDLVDAHTDLSLVADVLRDAVQDRRVTLPAVAELLEPSVFRQLVESAGLSGQRPEQAAIAAAAAVVEALGPEYFASLTRGIHETITATIARDLMGSMNLGGLRELLHENGGSLLPPGLTDSLRLQVAESIRPALEAARAATVAGVPRIPSSAFRLSIPAGAAAASQWASATAATTARATSATAEAEGDVESGVQG